jgi:asparagine N-glycosylation enzyme membrane subunit Stt3
MTKYLSTADLIVVAVTIILFVIALFVKGLTHDILLESGILLVSVKIIMMNYKNMQSNETILKELNNIRKHIRKLKD